MGMRYNVTILADDLEIYGGFKVGADCYKSHTKNVGAKNYGGLRGYCYRMLSLEKGLIYLI